VGARPGDSVEEDEPPWDEVEPEPEPDEVSLVLVVVEMVEGLWVDMVGLVMVTVPLL
jgi:hypothetical protein